MSDLSIALDARSRAQLPVHSYFDETLYRHELEAIFSRSPRYLGHELLVPEVGSYHVLAQEGKGRSLVRTEKGVELVSNVCRHRQAIILEGRGTAPGSIVCPVHRWTYALDGRLVGAPHFAEDPCLNLRNYALQRWNGLLFDGTGRDLKADLAGMTAAGAFDFTGYAFDRAVMHECDYNWKTFIEVYLEDYHVGPFHPGLGHFVTCDDLHWQFARDWSLQTVGVHQELARAGSKVYERWHRALLAYRQGEAPRQGAVWLTYYPTTMVEWYPHVLVVSTLFPRGPQKTLNLIEFFYPEEIAAFEREFVEAQQAAYMETCDEDDEIALRMDAGRRALMERGDNEVGPCQSPMEDGMLHFHEWYRREMTMPSEGPID